MKKKTISKTAQKKIDQKINSKLRHAFEEKELEKERKKEDIKDGIKHTDIHLKDIKDFNSTEFTNALKESGIDNSDGNVFADMERMVNNNESIRELVDIKNMNLKTNVTDEQHKIIVILASSYNTLLSRYNINFKGLKNILSQFIELAPSINGKRAEQFVTAHQAVAQAVANANNPNAIRQTSDMKS